METQQQEYVRLAHKCVWDAIHLLEKCGGRDGKIEDKAIIFSFFTLIEVSRRLYADI